MGPFKCTISWKVYNFLEKSFTKMYGSTLLALKGGGWVGVKFLGKNCYVTLEWSQYSTDLGLSLVNVTTVSERLAS